MRVQYRYIFLPSGPLNGIMEGYRVFEHHLDNCIKWVVTPPEG